MPAAAVEPLLHDAIATSLTQEQAAEHASVVSALVQRVKHVNSAGGRLLGADVVFLEV